MSLFDKMKADRITSLKEKQELKKNLLGTLIGDLTKNLKLVDGVKSTPSDEEIVRLIKKFISNCKDCIKEINGNPDAEAFVAKTNAEIEILESYLPQQLTESGLRTAITYAIRDNDSTGKPANLGIIMKYLKENHEGRYDGKLASEIAKELLA